MDKVYNITTSLSGWEAVVIQNAIGIHAQRHKANGKPFFRWRCY